MASLPACKVHSKPKVGFTGWVDFAGIGAKAYHAGLKDTVRGEVLREWSTGITAVVVATVAFGMGIDRASVSRLQHPACPDHCQSHNHICRLCEQREEWLLFPCTPWAQCALWLSMRGLQAGHRGLLCCADVRLVAHVDLPKTLEGFYQESGRAGRDGLHAESVLFYDIEDRQRMDYILSIFPSPNAQSSLCMQASTQVNTHMVGCMWPLKCGSM